MKTTTGKTMVGLVYILMKAVHLYVYVMIMGYCEFQS